MELFLQTGSEFAGRFQILEQAGAGGTATVYKAYDKISSNVVALKIFGNSERSRNLDPAILQEIHHRETAALSKLKHPNIVEFVDAGRDNKTNLKYISLEWVDGLTLEDELERTGALTWDIFQDKYGEFILSALVAAFEKNVIHRDVSTGNVIIDREGRPKIIDFGQARLSEFSLGRTVAGFATKPYCPPEVDTGTHTRTRDPYAFSAIAIRAMIGRPIISHDELYSELEHIEPPPEIKRILTKALNREPKKRFENIELFCVELQGEQQLPYETGDTFTVAVRISPSAEEQLTEMLEADDIPIDRVVDELQEAFAIYSLREKNNDPRMGLETQSFRLVGAIDSGKQDHLVIVGASRKLFQLDTLYGDDRWRPDITFTKVVPLQRARSESARQQLENLFLAFESFLTDAQVRTKKDVYDEWKNLLDALRYIERNRNPAVAYRDPKIEGRRLTVIAESWDTLLVGELRTIIDRNGTWLFRGEIEEVKGSNITLYSSWPRVDAQSIPEADSLHPDWQQARIALDRQERALEQFTNSEIANRRLASLITLEKISGEDTQYRSGISFFDNALGADKKALISQFLATPDLMVIHGPPGTGKTKLIVEAIRQVRAENPKARILLASQTHVALDNVLEKFIATEPKASITRIGSGNRDLDSSVAECSIEVQAEKLQKESEIRTRQFLRSRAEEMGVDFSDISLGLRAMEVLVKRKAENDHADELKELEQEMATFLAKDLDDSDTSTTETDANKTAMRSIEDEILEKQTLTRLIQSEASAALQLLKSEGSLGQELADQDQSSLNEWCSMLLSGHEQQQMKRLIELAEEWRLKFSNSAEVKTAVIVRSDIVAGTCVGFCREPASYELEFDVCIIDESSKATSTELLVPLSRSRKALMVGDHHQLPAVLDVSITSAEILERFQLSESTVERQLFETLQEGLGNANRGSLTTQYRMHPLISQLVSECFYDGELQSAEETKERTPLDLGLAGISTPLMWVDTSLGNEVGTQEQRNGTSFFNSRETQCIISLLRRIYFVITNGKVAKPPTIAVISGYTAQVENIRREISRDVSLQGLQISCDTVHAFQGREVDICLYSIVRSNDKGRIGFLREWRHLNVALSRARDNLIIVGDLEFSSTAHHPNPLAAVAAFIKGNDGCNVEDWHAS